jgi:ATP-independent RNA helicase DbpA
VQLKRDGYSVCLLNGDLEQIDRDQAMIKFTNHSRSLLVATDVAARGLDISELPAVINYEHAFEPEVYVHRVGRTGRAGCKGLALSITSFNDAECLCQIEELMGKPLFWEKIEALVVPFFSFGNIFFDTIGSKMFLLINLNIKCIIKFLLFL